MKQVVVKVPESKYSFFMKLMRSLNFVKVVDLDSTAEQQLSSAQKETWNNIKQGFEELKLAEEGKMQTKPIQQLLDEL